MLAVEAERVAHRRLPEPGDDRELLLETSEALTEGREGDAVGAVLVVVPAGADAQLDATARHLVDLRHRDRERARQPEGRGGDQRAEADPLGVAGETRQRDPRVGR